MGDPGGGSDFAGFYNHLGIPIAGGKLAAQAVILSLAVGEANAG